MITLGFRQFGFPTVSDSLGQFWVGYGTLLGRSRSVLLSDSFGTILNWSWNSFVAVSSRHGTVPVLACPQAG